MNFILWRKNKYNDLKAPRRRIVLKPYMSWSYYADYTCCRLYNKKGLSSISLLDNTL